MPRLRIKLFGQRDAVHELKSARITIGRRPDNTIPIDDASVSAHHAELVPVDGHYQLHDLGSTNFTFVNGVPTNNFDLLHACRITFGNVVCEYDPQQTSGGLGRSAAQAEKDHARYRAENAKLRFDLFDMKRRLEIHGSSRPDAGQTETPPPSRENEALEAVARERDELRNQNSVLQQELQSLREKPAPTDRKLDSEGEPTAPLETNTAPQPASLELLAGALKPVRRTIDRLARDPSDTATLAELALHARQLSALTTTLGTHPVNRLGQAIDGLVQDFAGRPQPPTGAQVWSLAQAANLTAHLLDPAHFERLNSYSAPRMLVVDDDPDLLDAVTASLNLAHLPTTPCNDSRQALALVENNTFDLLILDVRMPGLDGPTLCNQIREFPRYWKTPILFLTAADTLDYRAQTSLCGGNDFLPKPFNAAELVIKAETWLWRNRLGPLLAAE